jgi:hypothetical protein
VHTAKVDVAYNYEETLLVCQSRETTTFIENALTEAGIVGCNKRLIEDKYALVRNRVTSEEEHMIEQR